MSERRSWTRVDGFTSSLSLAVSLRDAVTDERPQGDPQVTVDDDDPDATTPNGYRVFLDRGEDAVTVAVDGGDRYLDEERTIDLLTHDPTDAVTFHLRPAPAYRFPPGATIVRGRVVDDSDDPVPDAEVSVQGLTPTTETDARGAYVYFFDLDDPDIALVERGDRTVVDVGGSDPTVEATHPDHTTVSESTEVEESEAAVVDLAFP